MKILASFNEIIDKTKQGFIRFPIAIIWAIIGTMYIIWYVDQDIDYQDEYSYIKIILVLVLGVSWLIATRLLVHYFKEKKANKSWLMLIPIVLLALYYFTLPATKDEFNSDVNMYRFILFLITGHLAIFFTPFIFTWDKKRYWNYLNTIFKSFAKSIIFSLVLYLGLVLALFAVKFLFKIEFDDIRFLQLFFFSLGIVNTWIFLSDLPIDIQKVDTIDYPKALLVFVKYILIPLTILYLIILFAYSAKILINWNLPKGWVSYLVIALSVLGFLIHILINPIRKTTDSKVISKFYPWFYYALLPMLILLFVAVFKRISDYGITENRYLVLILAIWILGMTLYIIFSKRKKLRYFPMTVAILSLLVSFGFWGMFSVSENSQVKQFEKIYTKMEANNFKVPYKDLERFKSITRYLSKRNALDKVTPILGFNPNEAFANEDGYYYKTQRLIDTLGIKTTDKPNRDGYQHYNTEHDEVIVVKGYDYMKHIYLNSEFNSDNSDANTIVIPVSHDNTNIGKYAIKIDAEDKRSLLVTANKTIHKIELNNLIKSLDSLTTYYDVPVEKMTITESFDEFDIKLLINSIDFTSDSDKEKNTPIIRYLGAAILIKEKD